MRRSNWTDRRRAERDGFRHVGAISTGRLKHRPSEGLLFVLFLLTRYYLSITSDRTSLRSAHARSGHVKSGRPFVFSLTTRKRWRNLSRQSEANYRCRLGKRPLLLGGRISAAADTLRYRTCAHHLRGVWPGAAASAAAWRVRRAARVSITRPFCRPKRGTRARRKSVEEIYIKPRRRRRRRHRALLQAAEVVRRRATLSLPPSVSCLVARRTPPSRPPSPPPFARRLPA